jgi:uncharacterized protein
MPANVYFEIQADDPTRAIEFYSAAFGWQFTEIKGLPIRYWSIDANGARGGLLPSHGPKPAPQSATNAFCCSFEVSDYDAAAAKITKAGAGVALPKFAVPEKCWQGYFLDLDGNVFGIFQPDENAGK